MNKGCSASPSTRDYATNGRFFVDYTDTAGNTVVAELQRQRANPDVADPTARRCC